MNIFPQCILVYFATAIYKSNSPITLYQKKEDNGEILWKIMDHNTQKESKNCNEKESNKWCMAIVTCSDNWI